MTWVSSLSMLRSSAPPPDMTMPLSMMSLRQLGRRLLEHAADGGDELLERLLDRLHDLGAGDRDRARQAGDQVAAADLHRAARARAAAPCRSAILTSSAVRSPIIRLYFLRM